MKTTIVRMFCCALVGAEQRCSLQEPVHEDHRGPDRERRARHLVCHLGGLTTMTVGLDVHVDGALGHWRLYHNDGGSNFSTVTSGPLGDYALDSLHGVVGQHPTTRTWTCLAGPVHRPSPPSSGTTGVGSSPVTTIGFRVPIRARLEGFKRWVTLTTTGLSTLS